MRGVVARYAALAVVAVLAITALVLAVRPLIFTLAPPRDDSVYAVTTISAVGTRPVVKELLLNQPHGLLGERPNDTHAAITVVVSRLLTGGYAVANAWSPVSDCAVTLGAGADRLVDCAGHAWTPAGDPFASGDPPLERFPVTAENGALVVDFTRPIGGGS